MPENPFHPPVDSDISTSKNPPVVSSGRAAYNVVTDTVTGVNVRWSDNTFQTVFIFVSVLLTALLGTMLAVINPEWDLPWFAGTLLGSFGGLVLGVLLSGTILMFYRAARHIKGRHD